MPLSTLVTSGQKCDHLIALVQADPDFAFFTDRFTGLAVHSVDIGLVSESESLALCIDIAGGNPALQGEDCGTLGPREIGVDVKMIRLGLIAYVYSTNRHDPDDVSGTRKRLCTDAMDRLVDIVRHYDVDTAPGSGLWRRSEFPPHWSALATTFHYTDENHKGLTVVDLYSDARRT